MGLYLFSIWLLSVHVFRSVLSTSPLNCTITSPSECPTIHDIDLSPLKGLWETVYYNKADGEINADVPSFFNISICGGLQSPTQCSGSGVCYSEHLQSFHNLGQNRRCEYDSAIRQIRFSFDYSPGLVFGAGNVTVTLVCGRTLGVPEVLEGDPNSHAIEILWVTSAACKTSSRLAPDNRESKCYHVHPYNDNGLKAKFIDLTNIIRPEGYLVSYPERPTSNFNISVCRPLIGNITTNPCAGSMACLVHSDPGFDSNISPPTPIANLNGLESSLHMEGNLLTVVYSLNVTSGGCYDSLTKTGNHSVKIHFLCPSENENLGPRITFLDDNLCLMVVHWYTSYACGYAAIQSTGCTLTTSLGLTFDLTGLSSTESVTSSTQLDSRGGQYRYDFQICSSNSLSSGCAERDQPIRVTQIDSDGMCRVLGVGAGKLRYVDGALTLTYGLGDTCHSNFARTSIINFVCPENIASNASVITFSGEEDCFYQFEWVTPLACGVETSGGSSCQFESSGGTYNFAPLVGTSDKNWVALDTDERTECFMINPCGSLAISPDKHTSAVDYCNARLAPVECARSSVCQVKKDGTFVKIGHFDFGSDPLNSTQVHSVDSNVLTVVGDEQSTNLSAVVHYVCKVGDLSTPPIFIGVTNDMIYEFHWMTYAACPTGVEIGQDCSVTHHSTGFLFNLTSLPTITFNKNSYQYNVSICKSLSSNQTACSQAATSAVCQSDTSTHHYSLGNTNSALIYEDGTLKLRYTGGDQCHHGGNPSRNTTLLFVCDNTAHSPVINDINEDYCDYVIEITTKKACPPDYQAHSCLYFDKDNHMYDFSELSRSSQNGNWEARGRDGSIYYINVCQPLNSVPGCNPLSAVCRTRVNGQLTQYKNIALASTANFSSSHTASGHGSVDSVRLTYKYTNVGGDSCPVVTTTIEFMCNKSTINVETGPKFISGGDEANPCDYLFSWETIYACPVHPITSTDCVIQEPSGYIFNLTSLGALNSSQSFFSTSSPEGHTYHLSICSPLDHPCGPTDNISVAVCQVTSQGTPHIAGLSNSQRLVYFDGTLRLSYTGGELCKHNNKNRSVLINFECDRTLTNYKGFPRFVSENEDCGYTFDWVTSLACLPRELECVAEGGKYNLQPLLQQQVWNVRSVASGYSYVIGGCRSLDFSSVPQCPQRPWMGACRYRHDDPPGNGTVLGYITGDIVEEKGNSLILSYHNGDCLSGKRGVVNVNFKCGETLGEPTLVEDDQANCVVRIDWTTKYACSRDSKVSDWSFTDHVTHQVFNLTSLPHSLSQTFTESDGSVYNYTVGLGGYQVPCLRVWKNDSELSAGACQRKLNGTANLDTHNIHALGFINTNTTLQYIAGEFSVEYLNGDPCHRVSKQRKTVLSFACEPSQSTFMEVFPEKLCEYTFIIHTPLVCRDTEDIGVPCLVPGYGYLDILSGLEATQIYINSTASAYVSVCNTLDVDGSKGQLSKCPKGAAACLINNDKAVHLGKPSHRSPPAKLNSDTGVLLKYTAGGVCGEERYSTSLLLVCNRNIPVGAPEFIEQDGCQFIFRWETIDACTINLAYSNTSDTICTIDDSSSEFVYDFTPLVNSQVISAVDTRSDTTYYIQLCGSTSHLPSGASGCDQSNTGICRKHKSDSTASTVLKASHRLVITSHSPHTIEVVYTSGVTCDSSRTWSAVVSLQCSSLENSTQSPVFQSGDGCRLDFVWQNSSFCVGEETCSVVDGNTGNVYNLDGLFAQTWTGVVASDDKDSGSFTMSVCRNLNPFSGKGSHCSSPSGLCLHTRDGRHVNLGHMTGPPTIQSPVTSDPHVTIQANYLNGDICNASTNARYHTTLFLHCSLETTSPILSLHDDTSNGNCSWTVAMETPLACPPPSNNPSVSQCVINSTEGVYDFSPLARNITFSSDGVSYSICLCKESSTCHLASINSSVNGEVTRLGDRSAAIVSSTTGGPRFTFSHGGTCSGSNQIKTIIFMECDRKADAKNGHLTFQSTLSDDCHKYFFWSTPYACISEEVSCSVATDTNDVLYDFSPLHSQGKPWKVTSGGSTYYINICGPINDREANGLEGCGPQSSVCVKTGDNAVSSLARTSTQRIQQYSSGSVPIRFSSDRSGGCHVTTIYMQCGVSSLTPVAISSGCTHVTEFIWKTPYACGDDQAVVQTDCSDVSATFDLNKFVFHPNKLNHLDSYNVTEGSTTYHVNLCGPARGCAAGMSVCDSDNNQIAANKDQTIMTEGYQLLFQMSHESSHAIVRVVCLVSDDSNLPSPNTLELENVGRHEQHMYYYFVLYTKDGCEFDVSTPATTPPSGETSTVVTTSASVTAIVIIVIAIAVILVVVMVIIFYKKERRDSVRHALEKLMIGKADEPVKYHRVSREDHDEETALMGESSDSGDSSDGVSGEEGVNGDSVRVEVDINRETNSDEELINL